MTCRHSANDPDCTHGGRVNNYNYAPTPEPPKTPDASNFSIVEAAQVKNHLVLKINYPNCSMCSYEGTKVLVFLNTTSIDALKWKKIDPHFRAPTKVLKSTLVTESPGPSARFPASPEGWVDAIDYANSKK
jgi:hypothetical protein